MLTLDDRQVLALMTVFGGLYDILLPYGNVRLIGRELPGKAVCAILHDTGDGVFRLVYDPGKPDAFRHVQAMIRDWWESYREPEVFPDGTVDLVQRVCPALPVQRKPVRLEILG